MRKEKVKMASRYGNLKDVTILRDVESHEVSYRQAVKAAANCAGDYFPGLEIDRYSKRAWFRN
jgi:hypothetical protein